MRWLPSCVASSCRQALHGSCCSSQSIQHALRLSAQFLSDHSTCVLLQAACWCVWPCLIACCCSGFLQQLSSCCWELPLPNGLLQGSCSCTIPPMLQYRLVLQSTCLQAVCKYYLPLMMQVSCSSLPQSAPWPSQRRTWQRSSTSCQGGGSPTGCSVAATRLVAPLPHLVSHAMSRMKVHSEWQLHHATGTLCCISGLR